MELAVPLPGQHSRELETRVHTQLVHACSQQHDRTAKQRKHLKRPPTNEWINQTWCVTVQWSFIQQYKEALTHATTWIKHHAK